jgi:hypothetical protein
MFSGLGYHGGTAPLAPGEDVENWATCMLIIGYTPARIVDGRSKWAFAALPQGQVLFLTPEMTIPEYVFSTTLLVDRSNVFSGCIQKPLSVEKLSSPGMVKL